MQQATSAHSATGTLASSGKIENDSATRRGFLGSLALVPAVVALPIPAVAEAHSRWDMLERQFEMAAAAVCQFSANVYESEATRIKAFVGHAPLYYERTFANGDVHRFGITMGEKSSLLDSVANDLHDRAVVARKNWIERSEVAERDPNWRRAEAQMEALYNAEDDARIALMKEPAPDGAALALKLQLALGNDDMWDADRAALLADAARLRHS